MLSLKRAFFNKRIPKNKFKFDTSSIDTITWLYKISSDTTDIVASNDIIELQVFEVIFKGSIDTSVVRHIQKYVKYDILFILRDKNTKKYAIMVNGNVLHTENNLIVNDSIDTNAMSLSSLVEYLVEQMLVEERKENESIEQLVDRVQALEKIDREIQSLRKKIEQEKQPKKKLEYNERLREAMRFRSSL